ncbi:Enolase-phosphatase E1 [Halotydeus destructor]|nr:Enolase-phosphatase E1 [Halotydeus destructor]
MVKISKPKAILLDVEGTTTSVRFYKETLVPFVKASMREFLEKRLDKPGVQGVITKLRKESKASREDDPDMPSIAGSQEDDEVIIKSVVKYVKYCLDKGGPLSKEMQDIFKLLWIYGYETGELKGHVYKDVATGLELWSKKKIKVYVISTGQVDVQTLLFANSTCGTLVMHIKDFFDATILAGKLEPKTYKAIAEIISEECDDILFLTDNFKEARAATKAGFSVVLVQRKENKPIPDSIVDSEEFRIIKSFDEIAFK